VPKPLCHSAPLMAVMPLQRLAVAQKDGQVVIIKLEGTTLTQETRFQVRKFKDYVKSGGIDEMRFNPAGDLLATGAHSDGKGNYIDIFSTEDPDASKWKKVKTLEGHTSFVTGLDWDVDGSIIKSTNGNPELLYHDTKGDKNSIPSGATSFSDTEWATFSTIVGWPVQGIFRTMEGQGKQMDMTDVNMVDINQCNTTIACGDDYGQVELYRYPCTRKGDQGKYYQGHSSHVTNVKFSPSSSHLISTGGHDLSVFQWRCT